MDFIKKASGIIQQNRLLQHILFWTVIVITNIPVALLDENDPIWAILIINFCIHIPQILAAYFFGYYLIPKFILKKRYFLSVLLFLLATYIFPAMGRLLTVHVGEELVRTPPFSQESVYEILTDIGKLLIHYLPVIYTGSFQFLFVKYFMDYKRSNEKQMLLGREKVESELKILKAQLNPHFLFNTLNNIYSLSLDNSPKTPIAIGKLSEILDHILYKCDSQQVSLSSEVNLLKNYIELEKLRYDDRLEVTFAIDLEHEIKIPPLLLLSLVENAFKHGAGEDSGSPKISIAILQEADRFSFEISNTVSKEYIRKDKATIGLPNIRKQLDLIYGTDYSLDIQSSSQFFRVILQINPVIYES
ncbi:sensor histidine kinase [Flavobacterium sp.]